MTRLQLRYFVPLLTCLLLGCNTCSDQVSGEVLSADGVLNATSFVRNCGATTDLTSIVSIHRNDEGFRDDKSFVFVAKGRHQLVVTWVGPKALSIRCPGCARADIFREVTALGHVDIVFDMASALPTNPSGNKP